MCVCVCTRESVCMHVSVSVSVSAVTQWRRCWWHETCLTHIDYVYDGGLPSAFNAMCLIKIDQLTASRLGSASAVTPPRPGALLRSAPHLVAWSTFSDRSVSHPSPRLLLLCYHFPQVSRRCERQRCRRVSAWLIGRFADGSELSRL